MAIQIGGRQDPTEFKNDLNSIFPESLSYTLGNITMNFASSHVEMKNGATRIIIKNADEADSDPLYLDVRPGPRTGKNQSAIVLDYSEKGSSYQRAITNEVFFNSAKPNLAKGDLKIRNPLEVLRDTAYGSFYIPGFRASGQQGRFNYLATHGDAQQQLVGGWLNVSPLITNTALQSLGRNVNVGFGEKVKNPIDALKVMSNWINPKGTQPAPMYADFFSGLAGLVPYKENGNRIRLHPVNESIPGANDANEYSFWYLNKIGKGHTATRGEREQLSETGMYQVDSESGLLEPYAPKIITDMQARGTSRLNVQMGNDGVSPSAAVSRNVLRVAGLPDSGGRVSWGPTGTDVTGEVGPFFPTGVSENLHPKSVSELQRTTFQWGIFEKGEKDSWIRKSSLVGYSLAPKQKVVLGLKSVMDTKENVTTTPIEYTNTNRITMFRGLPTLYTPPAVNDITDEFAPVAGNIQSREGNYQSRELSEKELQTFKTNMGGGDVSPTTMFNVALSIPIGVENAVGEKQLGVKQSVIQDWGTVGEKGRTRNVHIGSQEVALESITGSVKNPLLQFMYGQVGTMPTPKIRQLVADVYGKKSPLLEEIDKTIAYQQDLINNTNLTSTEKSQQWRGVDIERLAAVQAKESGTAEFESSPLLFMRDFRNRTLDAQRANPERFWNEYQMGEMSKTEYVDYKTINAGDVEYQRARLKAATDLLYKEDPKLYTKEKMEALNDLNSPESLYKFDPVEGKPDLSKWSISSFGSVGTQAAGFVTEPMYRDNPRFSLEQIMATASQYPKSVIQGIMSQGKRLENLGVKSWSAMYDYYKSMQTNKVDAEGKPLTFGKGYTTLTNEQAAEISGKLNNLEGNNPNLMQETVDETIGKKSAPLLRMESTGAILPAPKTLKGVSEMEVIDEERVIDVDRLSKLYPEAISDFLKQKPESGSQAMSSFGNQAFDALTATGGGIMKKQESVPVVGGGGHMGGASGLNPNVGVITESDMRKYILESMKVQNVSPLLRNVTASSELNKTQQQLLDKAYNMVRKQGGLPAFYTKSPPYTRGDSVIPLLLRDPRMARDSGIQMPDATRVVNGKVIRGNSSMWGMTGLTGSAKELLYADTDVDPGVFAVQEKWGLDKHGSLIATGMQSNMFKGLATQSGTTFNERAENLLKSVSGANFIDKVSAPVNELMGVIKNNFTPEAQLNTLNDDKLKETTQLEAVESGISAVENKTQMGVAYNTRRRIESVMEADPRFNQEDLDRQYSAFGLSYEKNLEQPEKIPARGYEKLIQSFTPFLDADGKVGFKYISGKKGDDTPRFTHSGTFDFNIGAPLIQDFKSIVGEDVEKGLLNPDAALSLFARGSERLSVMEEEFNKNPNNRSSTAKMSKAVSNIIDIERNLKGFDFSETLGGEILAGTFADKLRGTSGRAYSFPKNSPIGANERAEKYLREKEVTYQGETTTVKEFLDNPAVNASNIILKAQKRKTGVLTTDELYQLDTYARQSGNRKDLTRHLLNRFGAADVSKAFEATGVHEKNVVDLEAFRNYKPNPNELTKVLDETSDYRKNTLQSIFGKTQLGLSHTSNYVETYDKFTKLGTKFEDDFANKIISEEGYQSTYRPSNMTLGETGSTFDWSGRYRPDVMGIDPKTKQFFVGDFKWLGSKAKAEEVENNSAKSLPQITAYADAIYRMANPEKYEPKWDEIKQGLAGSPEETYFTNKFIESMTSNGKTFNTIESASLREKASIWHHAIKESGIERITLTGTGGIDATDKPMEYRKATSWGDYTPEEAEKYNAQATQIMQATTSSDILSYAHDFSDSIKEAESHKANVEKLGATAASKLGAMVDPRGKYRQESETTINEQVNTPRENGTNPPRDNNGNDDNNRPSGRPRDPMGEGPLTFTRAADTTGVNEFIDLMAKGFSPYMGGQQDQYARPFSSKELAANITEQRFNVGIMAVTDLQQQKDYLLGLPKYLAKETSAALIAKGVRPSITYNETTNKFKSGRSNVEPENAIPGLLSDMATLENVDNTAYKGIAGNVYSAAHAINKDVTQINKGIDAARAMGVSSDTPEQYIKYQEMEKAKASTPGLEVALALSGRLDKPTNKPAGVRGDDSEETSAAVVKDFEKYTKRDVIGEFDKQLDITIKKLEEFEKSVDGSTDSQLKLNSAQKEIIAEKAKSINTEERYNQQRDTLTTATNAFGEVTAGRMTAAEAAPFLKKGITAGKTMSRATTQLAKQEEGIQDIEEGDYPGGAKSIGQSFRSALGGFGLFYLRTLGSYGFGSYQKGYAASNEQKQLLSNLQQNLYGGESTSSFASPEIEQQRRLLISGGSTWDSIQKTLNKVGGNNTDVSGALMSGLGAYAAVEHLSPLIASVGNTLGANWDPAGVQKAAPAIGMIVTGAMFANSMISNAVNRNDSVVRAAAAFSTGDPLGGAITSIGPVIRDILENNFTTVNNKQDNRIIPENSATNEIIKDNFTVGGLVKDANGNWSVGSGYLGISPTGKDAGERTPTSVIEQRKLQEEKRILENGLQSRASYNLKSKSEFENIVSYSQQAPPKQWERLEAGKIGELMYRYQTGDMSFDNKNSYDTNYVNQIKDIGLAEQAGRDITGMSTQVYQLAGLGYKEAGDKMQFDAYLSRLTLPGWEKAKVATNLMSSIPSAIRDFSSLATSSGKIDEDALTAQFDKYSEIALGKNKDTFLERASIVNNALKVGNVIPLNDNDYLQTFTPEQVAQQSRESQFETKRTQLTNALQQTGAGIYASKNFINSFQTPGELNFAERLMSFSPTAIGDFAQMQHAGGNYDLASYMDKFALTDYNMAGEQTGLGHWATSLRGATSSAVDNANMIWGKGKWEGTQLGRAATYGVNRDTGEAYTSKYAADTAMGNGANVTAGERGIQWLQYQQGVKYQNDQFALQQKQIGSQERYMYAGWAQEDKQREFSYRQQEWSFGQQEASAEMQNRQFQQNMGLQQKQASMQRSWAQEDWGYQDLTRSMQWGWKQEDFAEQSRFMTGRDRKIAERGMERETTMYNLEGGQIDKTRDRQKQTWALEDERFAVQKEQYTEQKKFQEEALAKQREFFEEQKALTAESTAIGRQYQMEQIALQKESLALQMQYAKDQSDQQAALMIMSDKQEDMQGAFALAKEKQVEFFNLAVGGFEFLGVEFKQMLQSIISGKPYTAGTFGGPSEEGSGGGGYGGATQQPMANGGDMFPGMGYIVGESGAERVRPRTLGSVVNQYDIAQTLKQTDRWTNRSVFYPSGQSGDSSGSPQTINVYVGNEKLASFVLNTVKSDLEVL